MKKSVVTLMAAVSVFALASAAKAEMTPYVGLDYAYSDVNTEELDNYSPDYNSYSVNVGTNYNDYFGTEVFYQQSDNDKKRIPYGDEGQYKTDFQAWGIDMIGYLPFGCDKTFALFGTAGIAQYKFDYKVLPGQDKKGDNGVGYRLGAGAQYNIDEHFAVRALARYVALDQIDDSVNADHMMEYVAGVRYTF